MTAKARVETWIPLQIHAGNHKVCPKIWDRTCLSQHQGPSTTFGSQWGLHRSHENRMSDPLNPLGGTSEWNWNPLKAPRLFHFHREPPAFWTPQKGEVPGSASWARRSTCPGHACRRSRADADANHGKNRTGRPGSCGSQRHGSGRPDGPKSYVTLGFQPPCGFTESPKDFTETRSTICWWSWKSRGHIAGW